MNPQNGEIVDIPAKIQVPPGWVPWTIGEEVMLKGCRFRVSFIHNGKRRISLEAMPQKEQ